MEVPVEVPVEIPTYPIDAEKVDTLFAQHADMAYYGWYMSYEVLVDRWYLTLSDSPSLSYDIETDRYSGAKHVVKLCLHTKPSLNQLNPDWSNFGQRYGGPTSDYDIYPGEYEIGYDFAFDHPYYGRQYATYGSYFVDLSAGEYDIDYLREGSFTIEDLGGGSFKVYGTMVGNKFQKRHFVYEGPFQEGSFDFASAKDSNLSSDIILTEEDLPNISIKDDGHPFGPFMTDNACRNYYVYLYQDGVEFAYGKPSGGSGAVMQLNLYVDWDAGGKIPAGTYTLTDRNDNYSIDRDKGVPFRFVQGYPHRYSDPQGCWYFNKSGEFWGGEYGMVMDGSLAVSYNNDKLAIEADFIDCSNPAKHIKLNWKER